MKDIIMLGFYSFPHKVQWNCKLLIEHVALDISTHLLEKVLSRTMQTEFPVPSDELSALRSECCWRILSSCFCC